VIQAFLERGLAPSIAHLLPLPINVPTCHVRKAATHGYYTGRVFIDGSVLDPTCADRARAGFGKLMIDHACNDAGSAYGPAPLVHHTSPGAEAYAMLDLLQNCLPPLIVYSDCQETLDCVYRGKHYATAYNNVQAHVWCAIWAIIDDIGLNVDGLTVYKTLAHATGDDVARGLTTWWEKQSNDDADRLAKMGAACHPRIEFLDKAWKAMESRVKDVAKHLGRTTARLGADIPRDCSGTKAARPKAKAKATAMVRQGPRPIRASDLVWLKNLGQCSDSTFRRHKLVEADLSTGGVIQWCQRCGAYSTGAPRNLIRSCPGEAERNKAGHDQLQSLRDGRYPHNHPRYKSVKVFAARPLSEANLLSRIRPDLIGQIESVLAPAHGPRAGCTLEMALSMVGLSSNDVEVHHAKLLNKNPGRAQQDCNSDEDCEEEELEWWPG